MLQAQILANFNEETSANISVVSFLQHKDKWNKIGNKICCRIQMSIKTKILSWEVRLTLCKMCFKTSSTVWPRNTEYNKDEKHQQCPENRIFGLITVCNNEIWKVRNNREIYDLYKAPMITSSVKKNWRESSGKSCTYIQEMDGTRAGGRSSQRWKDTMKERPVGMWSEQLFLTFQQFSSSHSSSSSAFCTPKWSIKH